MTQVKHADGGEAQAAPPASSLQPPGWPEDAGRDRLIGDWHLYQRKRGHRSSTDDLITAWLAVHMLGGVSPSRYLDLGCGIGSVLLLTAYRLRPAESIGVEAQDQSVLLARRTIAELPDPPAIEVIHSDFREVNVERLGKFPVITGSPPYLPVGTGVISPDPQRAACRFELRGGIEAYCATAAPLLEDDGVFCVVFQSQWDDRVMAAAVAADLHLHYRLDLATRGTPDQPFLSVYAFGKHAKPPTIRQMSLRDTSGEITAEYQALRAELGLDAMR